MLREINKFAEWIGKVPTIAEFNNNEERSFSSAMAIKHFGTWNKFLESAGLKSSTKKYKNYSDEELIAQVQRLAKKLGRTPMAREWQDDKETASYATVFYRFGSWNRFLSAAGLRLNQIKIRRTKN